MTQHYSKSTIEAPAHCPRCEKTTPHRVADGRIQFCIPCFGEEPLTIRLPKPTPVNIEAAGLFDRFIIVAADNPGIAWTGSQFAAHTMGIGHRIQISNFDSLEEARIYVDQAERLELAPEVRQS